MKDKDAAEREAKILAREKAAKKAALEAMSWKLYAIPLDVHDIRDGERPVGEFMGEARGISQAVGRAKKILELDPGIIRVRIVPVTSAEGVQPMRVDRTTPGKDVMERLGKQQPEDSFEWHPPS